MKIFKLLPIIITLLVSCTYSTKDEINILKQAEYLLDQYPDSALFLIESIHTKDNMSEDQLAKYELLKIRAKDKCYEDISSDTVIFQIRDYYLVKGGNGNEINTAMALLYSGLVLLEQGDNKSAMTEFLQAEKHIDNIEEREDIKGLIQANIANSFYRELLIDEAAKRFKTAAYYFKESGQYTNEAVAYNQLGICCLMTDPLSDSVTYYLQKGLQIADKSKDIRLKSTLRQNIGIMWSEHGRPDSAIVYLKDALNYTVDNPKIVKIYYNIANVYVVENKIDSAQYYIACARSFITPGSDYPIIKYLNKLDSKILQLNGKYKEALELNEEFVKFMEETYLSIENKAILDIEKKYNYELIKNKHNEQLIKNQRWIIALLLLLFIFITLGISHYIKSYKNKKALEDAEQKIISFTDMVESYKQKNEVLRQKDETFKGVLFEHFNILKKSALLEGYLKQEDKENGAKILRKFNEIIYGKEKLDWVVLYDAMNNLHNGFLDSLHKTFPKLDEEEFKVCCLIYNDFSNTEISIITGFSNRTITARRSSIRKKIGIDDYGNINEFLKIHVKY